ncbi:PHB depolymerase family esterase [Paracoccus sp. PAR01]|uniref:extracellular catalytic domain type 1 short-chain-length polyhydroxyalkanoate depolymerase n=1 Tax=Paracoccus sp. PAR01 TaxID=2769282 RepID=UPI001CE0E438|nr:PHB depolymerase family esterase [Paracoccus sp. PAR01]
MTAAALKTLSPIPAIGKKRSTPKKAITGTNTVKRKTGDAIRANTSMHLRMGVHECEHGTRRYKIYEPSTNRGSSKASPLLVMLHGCGQTPDDFAIGTGMNALADQFGLIVVYPAQARDAHPNRCWNWFHPTVQNRGAGEPAILASLTWEILQTYNVDPARVYIAGLSAGASMALLMTSTYPELFAAVGVHSGLPAGAARDQASAMTAMQRGNPGARLIHPIPTIIFHGSHDPVVNPRNGRLVAIRAREPHQSLHGAATNRQTPNGRAYTKTVYRKGSGRPLVEHWSIKASGHAWSGGTAKGRFTDPKGPDASREMVRFFIRHKLSARKRSWLASAQTSD